MTDFDAKAREIVSADDWPDVQCTVGGAESAAMIIAAALKAAYTQGYSDDALDPKISWWEDIEVDDRNLNFYVFRHGASFTTLVCEDLARMDPCQSVLRSVGPNLVVALLFDGPQLASRWPSRYAMSLADDPGSSVLSVTSLGLVHRSNHVHGQGRRVIALWRDSYGITKELELPSGKHALLLSLTGDWMTEHTLDGRSDGKSAYLLRLSGITPVALKDPPGWLNLS